MPKEKGLADKVALSLKAELDRMLVIVPGLEPGIISRISTTSVRDGKTSVSVVLREGLSEEDELLALEEELKVLGDPAELLKALHEFHELVETGLWAQKVPRPEISIGTVIVPEKPVSEGVLIRSTSVIWASVVEELKGDWDKAYSIPWRVWEEIIAGAYLKAGFDEVVLTSRASDHGRDVIAVRRGVGSVRILGSVKAYRPGHLVTKEEVHALLGVVSADSNASKGILTTTSDFAPRLLDDPRLAASVPHRIELMNGRKLQQWLTELIGRL